MKKEIESLKEIGLTNNEAKTYYTLLKLGEATASTIATAAKIARAKVYEMLNSLVIKGFVSEYPGPTKIYKANSPKLAFKYYLDELEHKRSLVCETREYFQPIFEQLLQTQNTMTKIELILNRNTLVNKVEELIPKTKKHILSFSKPPYMVTEHDPEWDDIDELSHNFNIDNRTLLQIEYDRLDEFLALAKKSRASGEIIRLTDEVPIKFIIFDEDHVIFHLIDHAETPDYLAFLSVPNRGLVSILTEVFNIHWNKGITIEQFEKEYFHQKNILNREK